MSKKTLLLLVVLLIYVIGIGYMVFHSSDSSVTTSQLSPGVADTAIALLEHPPETKQFTALQMVVIKGPRREPPASTATYPVGGVRRAAPVAASPLPPLVKGGAEGGGILSDKSDKSDKSDLSDTGTARRAPTDDNCYSFSDTLASGTIATAQLCGSFLPAETPPDTRGSITILEHPDTAKTITRNDTVKVEKTIVKKPLISPAMAGVVGVVLGAVAMGFALR